MNPYETYACQSTNHLLLWGKIKMLETTNQTIVMACNRGYQYKTMGNISLITLLCVG